MTFSMTIDLYAGAIACFSKPSGILWNTSSASMRQVRTIFISNASARLVLDRSSSRHETMNGERNKLG